MRWNPVQRGSIVDTWGSTQYDECAGAEHWIGGGNLW